MDKENKNTNISGESGSFSKSWKRNMERYRKEIREEETLSFSNPIAYFKRILKRRKNTK